METMSTSVSFTGYRTYKILLAYNTPDSISKIEKETYNAIELLYKKGYKRFLSGMAEGFDMIAAEAVLKLKKEYKDVELVAVIPFAGQELKLNTIDVFRYNNIVKESSEVIYISKNRRTKAYFDRNDYLIDNCSALVCFYSGIKGGTQYTYNRALKKRLEIINIFLTFDKTPNLFE